MKQVNHISFRIFIPSDIDKEIFKNIFNKQLQFDLQKEKIIWQETQAKGFDEKIITILTLKLVKQRHVKNFMNSLKKQLTSEQKKQLREQQNRLDETLHFFIRLDLKEFLKNNYILTDKGNCVHITFSIAAYPATKNNAYTVITDIFK